MTDAVLARTALVVSVLFAWGNFLTTARWANQPGALHGWRKPWYALALVVLGATSAVSQTPSAALEKARRGVYRRRRALVEC